VTRQTDTRLAVLKVLAGQSPGYFIFPNASAFVAEGLDPEDVADALEQLHRDGKLERELLLAGPAAAGENGESEQLAGGYRLKGGDDDVDDETTPTPDPDAPDPEPEDEDE
jgi:hypothetical protein